MSDIVSFSSSQTSRWGTNPDGTTNVRCRQCGRIVARVINPQVRTISECAICQGLPPDKVLSQYVQTNPGKPPVPLMEDDPVFLYEEEQEASKGKKPWTGLMKPLFRALGIDKYQSGGEEEAAPEPKPEPRSKRVARSKKSGGLFERE